MATQATTTDGVTFSIPELGDENWDDVNPALVKLIEGSLLEGAPLTGPQLVTPPNTVEVADGGTLTPGNQTLFIINGDGEDSVLDLVTPIAAGTASGAHLILVGGEGDYTITVPDESGSNLNINGPCTLEPYQSLTLIWVTEMSLWLEISRNN